MGAPCSLASGVDELAGDRSAEIPALSPTMSSMQNLALDFINRYFARWGQSPTLGELAAHLGTSRKRAHEIVHQLAAKQMIEVVAGKARGIRLVDRTKELSEQVVLARLLAEGWTIGAGSRIIFPPGEAEGVTENGLFLLPLLDHLAEADQMGMGTNGETETAGVAKHGRTRAAADPEATNRAGRSE
jgi:hypothetical protein